VFTSFKGLLFFVINCILADFYQGNGKSAWIKCVLKN